VIRRILTAIEEEMRRQMTGPVRLRRQVFSPRREYRRIARRVRRVAEDPSFTIDTWESHQPVLVGLLTRLPGSRVLELGMGYASTPVVLALSSTSVSIETEEAWFARFSKFARPGHEFVLVAADWRTPYLEETWDVVFVDNSPYSTRQSNLIALADKARFIVCHDTEECFKPAGSDYRWDFSSFRHVWTYTRFDNYTTVVSNVEPIPLELVPGIGGQPPGRR
jgi:hypothetical protein